MACQKNVSYLVVIGVALGVELLSVSLAVPQLRTQSPEVSDVTFVSKKLKGRLRFKIRGIRASMGRGLHGRQWCIKGNKPLMALIPNNNVATTVAANPTLFWYVPQSEAKSAEFLIFDLDREQEVYKTTLALDGIPGVVKLSLPKAVSLETGKEYMWQLALICNPEKPEEQDYVRGMIERTQLSSDQKIKLADATEPLKQAEVYAEAGIWLETLIVLSQLHHERPNDSKVNDAWKELLESVELEVIATEPLIDCCRLAH